ncbi:hypothetical protein ACFQZP_50055, partial [Streptomyces lutosisoli]
ANAAASAGHAKGAGGGDFALYGDTYGTLLVDATTRLPLTLWAGRDAEQLSRWLRAHPGVEVACRDGSLTYRQGIADGPRSLAAAEQHLSSAGNDPSASCAWISEADVAVDSGRTAPTRADARARVRARAPFDLTTRAKVAIRSR